MPKVKGLRVILKKTGFIKVSLINQVKKHSQQKVDNSDRFLYLDLRKQVV